MINNKPNEAMQYAEMYSPLILINGLIWFSPPCTPWSNATPLVKRKTPEYITMGKLCEFAVNLALEINPRGFIIENSATPNWQNKAI
jgi:hypothetical protein